MLNSEENKKIFSKLNNNSLKCSLYNNQNKQSKSQNIDFLNLREIVSENVKKNMNSIFDKVEEDKRLINFDIEDIKNEVIFVKNDVDELSKKTELLFLMMSDIKNFVDKQEEETIEKSIHSYPSKEIEELKEQILILQNENKNYKNLIRSEYPKSKNKLDLDIKKKVQNSNSLKQRWR